MKTILALSALAMFAVGCSDSATTRAQRAYDDENQVAVPAASNLKQAERTGYLNATDPESYPRTDDVNPPD